MRKIIFSLVIVLLLHGCGHSMTGKNINERHYVVVDVDVSDINKYDEFISLELPILAKHDAYMAMDVRSKDQKKRFLVVSFPDKQSVTSFVKSEEFKAILPLNKSSAKSKIFHGKLHAYSNFTLSDRHYVVVDVDVTDTKQYDKFISLEIPILKKYDAYMAMDIRSQDQMKRHLFVSFPSKEAVGRFVKSEEFQKILPLNKASAQSVIFHGELYNVL